MADRFSADPDHALETADIAGTADDVVRKLMTQYVNAAGHIHYDSDLIENPAVMSPVVSLKLRGEESVRSILKDLALRAQSASWGVDAYGKFFFLKPRNPLLVTYREQRDLVSLAETRDVEYLFNRLLLTGDYVYDQQLGENDVARRAYRWRGNYFEPGSRSQYGDRRLKVWLPWVRTQEDSLAFAREFFRAYAQPVSRYLIETTPQAFLPCPWLGRVGLESAGGTELARARIETLRVLFDHVPRFRMELGPEDPRDLWPEPPQDERWELPNQRVSMGGPVSDPSPLPSSGGGGGGTAGGGDSSQVLLSSDDDFSFDGGDSTGDSSDGSDDSEAESSHVTSGSGSWITSVWTSGGPWLPSIEENSSAVRTSVDDSLQNSSDESDDVTGTSVPLTSFVWSPTFPSTGAWETHVESSSEEDSSSEADDSTSLVQ